MAISIKQVMHPNLHKILQDGCDALNSALEQTNESNLMAGKTLSDMTSALFGKRVDGKMIKQADVYLMFTPSFIRPFVPRKV